MTLNAYFYDRENLRPGLEALVFCITGRNDGETNCDIYGLYIVESIFLPDLSLLLMCEWSTSILSSRYY